MEGTIVNFRGGRRTQKGNHMIIKPSGVADKEKATSLVGKTVTWTNAQGTAISGKVASAHGNSGCVRAIFERGMPGQSIGAKVKLA